MNLEGGSEKLHKLDDSSELNERAPHRYEVQNATTAWLRGTLPQEVQQDFKLGSSVTINAENVQTILCGSLSTEITSGRRVSQALHHSTSKETSVCR